MSTPRISRAVPLEQLRPPETDVREHRDEQSIRSLAASMGDPAVGQLQDVLVHPVDPGELPDELDADDLDRLHREGYEMRIVDGETRRLAAEHLGWHALDATIVPAPPEHTVVAQLDANTERLDMSGYETCRALYQHYDQTDSTLEDMSETTGFSESYLSRVFSLFEAPDCIQDAWRHPDHPLGTSHAIACRKLLSPNTLEKYQEAGGLDEEAAWDAALEDVRLMIDVQGQHDLAVGEFRKRVSRRISEHLDSLRDQRTHEEKTADGQTARAERAAGSGEPAEIPEHTCLVCGDTADRKIALNVCTEDYGMLSDMQARGETLMSQAPAADEPAGSPREPDSTSAPAAQAIADELGLPPEQAREALHAIEQQIQGAAGGARND